MSTPHLDSLFQDYTKDRNLNINKEQFIYIVNLLPALLVVLSDGIVDREEWTTVKKLAKILGSEFATDELGEEKEENLTLIYRSEFRHLLKSREQWESRFMDALKEYFTENDSSKDFVLETMYLFANASDGISEEEDEIIVSLCKRLGINDDEEED